MQVQALSKYYLQLDEIERNLESKAYEIIAKLEDQIVALNTGNLMRGLTPKGERLKPYKSDYYAKQKNKQNPAAGYGNPDLNRSGGFHADFYITAADEKFEFFSSATTVKGFDLSGHLTKEYGRDNIFGLSVKDNEIANYQIILPELLEWVLSKLKV